MIETRKSYCRICQAFCAVEVDVDPEAGRLLAVRGDASDPMTGGYTCVKGRQLPDQLADPARLRGSLRRAPDGGFEPIASERAMDEISERLREIVAAHGPRAVASYSGTCAYFNAATLPVLKAWHRGLGSPSYYTSLTIDQPAKIVAVARQGVWGAGTHSFASADVALVIGNNPIVSQLAPPSGVTGFDTVRRLNQAKRRGLTLICVDPRRTELARRADLHLQIRPGEDPTLLAGMLRVILSEGLHDAAFCAEHVTGLEALREALEDFEPEYVAERSGVPAAQMIEAARRFAGASRGCATSGTGPDMAPHPNLSEHLIMTLNSVCGRVNRAGEKLDAPGVLSPAVPRPAMAVPPALLPPHLSLGDGPRSRVRGLRQIFEEMPTPALADEILLGGEGQLRALLVTAGNPILAWPDQRKTLRALQSLDLLVCLDVSLSATARHADYVVAAPLPLERDDVTLFSDIFYEMPYAHYAPAVLAPGFDAVEEWAFFAGLARRMGTPIELPGGALDPERRYTTFEVLELVTHGSRVPLERVRAREGGQLFEDVEVVAEPAPPGNPFRLDVAPQGIPEELRAVRAEPVRRPGHYGENGRFSHLLICRRLRHVMNSVGQGFPQSRAVGTTNSAYLNPADLERLGLAPGEVVEIESEHDAIPAVVEPADDIQPGVVSMAHGFGTSPELEADVAEVGANTGRLVSTETHYDPLTGMVRQSAIPVRLRRPSS